MKTLKFMLAAATAIGLASASQADTKDVVTPMGSENFDSMTVGTAVTGSTAGFAYAGDDNESVIVSGGANSTANALQVSVGTDPLLRALDYTSDAAHPVDLAGLKSLDIDTYVQFTVTPASDTVETNAADKLMIYLKETTNVVNDAVTYSTNLMVKTARYVASTRPGVAAQLNATDVAITNVTVNPGTWYNLKVTAHADADDVVYFNIYLDGAQLACGTTLYTSDVDGYKFPSLLGKSSTTLQYVGFAGEGLVDELSFSKTATISSVDFTLTLGENVSSVAYSITNVAQAAVSEATTVQVFPGDKITLGEITYASGYVAADGSPVASGLNGNAADGYTVGNAACSLTFSAKLNSVDFTFRLGTGVSAISWTIEGGSASSATSGSGTPGASITINSVTYDDWYVAAGSVTKGAVLTAEATTFNVEATATAVVDSETGKVTVESTTTPAQLGIIDGAFKGEEAGSDALSKVVAWATTTGKGGMSASAAIAAINGMTFTEGEETQAEKAYLFNVANDATAVANAEAAFKFNAIDTSSLPPVISGTNDVNGTVSVKGANAVNGTWEDASASHKFFKATLTK